MTCSWVKRQSFGAFRLASGMPIDGNILIPLVVFYFDEGVGHYTVIHMGMCETSYDYSQIERPNPPSVLMFLLEVLTRQ